MAWVDFNTIQDDLVTLLQANVSAAKLIKKEADDRDYQFSNMPLVDVRLTDMNPQVRAGQDYFVFVTFDVQVTTFDLSDYSEAATLRDTVLGSVIDTVRNNANFSSSLETSTIGSAAFEKAKDENNGQFMAAATVQIEVQAFIDK